MSFFSPSHSLHLLHYFPPAGNQSLYQAMYEPLEEISKQKKHSTSSLGAHDLEDKAEKNTIITLMCVGEGSVFLHSHLVLAQHFQFLSEPIYQPDFQIHRSVLDQLVTEKNDPAGHSEHMRGRFSPHQCRTGRLGWFVPKPSDEVGILLVASAVFTRELVPENQSRHWR